MGSKPLIITFEQGSEEWSIWRAGGLGSSDIACIMGRNPYRTAYQLWEYKMGLAAGPVMNEAMQRGKDHEEEAREWIEDRFNLPICPPCCFQSAEFPFMRASLDGCCLELDLLIEIKTPTERTFRRIDLDEYYHQYECQVQWQMLVSDLSKGIFAVYSPEQDMCLYKEVERDEVFIEELKAAAIKFWGDFLRGTPPALSEKDYEVVFDEELRLYCEEYQRVHEKLKEFTSQAKPLEDELKGLKSKILDFGNDGNFAAYGIKCCRMAPRVYYDMEAMEADGIDISRYKRVKNEIGSYRITVGKK